ncbi:unnamed protein product [Closterium sp. NIES-64]|nr:unnamed protein product [Closterium sp. NIES-64]
MFRKRRRPSQLVSKKSPAQEQQKKMSPGEEMESEWQQIVDYYDPANVGEARGGGEEEGACRLSNPAMEANREQEQAQGSAQAAAREAAAFGGPVCAVPAGAAAVNEMDDGSSGALKALEELEMEEEFLQWASYVFRDGATESCLPACHAKQGGWDGWRMYEGTVWNDMAQGKGVYTTPLELCKAMASSPSTSLRASRRQTPSEPPRNPMRSSFPAVPLFPSFLPSWFLAWRKLKAEGKVFEDEEMSAEDREWLRMELEDLSTQEADAKKAGEKGHYEYAGQMKQNKFHGCGFFTLNGKMHFVRQVPLRRVLRNKDECDAHTSGGTGEGIRGWTGQRELRCGQLLSTLLLLHALPLRFISWLARTEICLPSPSPPVNTAILPLSPCPPRAVPCGHGAVAAAKARMFVNKPDGSKSLPPLPCLPLLAPALLLIHAVRLFLPLHGLPAVVREVKGPYNEPSHPYLYDDNGMWQAPVGHTNEPSHPYLYDEDDMWQAPGSSTSSTPCPPLWRKGRVCGLRNRSATAERAGESAEEAEMRRADMQGRDGKVDPSKARPLPLGFDEFIKGEEMEQEEEEEEEQEESEEARRLKTPEQLQRDAQRRRAKAAEARRRRVARVGAGAAQPGGVAARAARGGERARQDAEEEELRRLEEEEWQREGDLMDADAHACGAASHAVPACVSPVLAARRAPLLGAAHGGAARASQARQQQHSQEVAVGGILSLALPLPATPSLA